PGEGANGQHEPPDDAGGRPDTRAVPGKPEFDVVVRLTPFAKLLPPLPARPELRLWRGDTRVPALASWVAGTASLPMARDIRGRQLVRFLLRSGQEIYRIVHLGRDLTGPVDVEWTGTVGFHGQVVDSAQKPIAYAKVWFAGEAAITDAEGKFHIMDLPRGVGLPLVIRAPRGSKPAYADYFRVLDLSRRDAGPAVFPLDAGTQVRVRLVVYATSGRVADLTKARAMLGPAGNDLDTRLLHHPFFMQAVEGGTPLGEDGTTVVHGLPAGVNVRVTMVHPGTLIQQRVLRWRRRSTDPESWTPGAGVAADAAPIWQGRALDEAGKPLGDVWAVSRGLGDWEPYSLRNAPALLPALFYLSATLSATEPFGVAVSSRNGHFRLPLAGKDRTRVRLHAAGCHVVELELDPGQPAFRRDIALPLPAAAGTDRARVGIVFLRPRGRSYRLRVLVGDKPVQAPVTIREDEHYAVALPRMMLADVVVEATKPGAEPRRWSFEGRAVQGLLELMLDY
ncbi:MAG: peptidase associated/transthyretin-like domain-containing protein, partial [Planctomycetota bacterium]